VVVVIIAATAATEQSSQSFTDDHSIETKKDATDRIPRKPNQKTKNEKSLKDRSSIYCDTAIEKMIVLVL
jgi:hypothetical protein